MAQWEQLQPQEDLPFFLSLIVTARAAMAMAIMMAAAIIVPTLFKIQEIISNSLTIYEPLTFFVSFVASL